MSKDIIHYFNNLVVSVQPTNFFRDFNDSGLYNISESFDSYYRRDPTLKSEWFSMNCSFCLKCGDYRTSSSGLENVYCKCSDFWNKRCRAIEAYKQASMIRVSKQNFNILMDELENKMCIPERKFDGLQQCTYYHEGPCLPNSRVCGSGCWKVWCGKCSSGIGGMYGQCNYKRCDDGIKNLKKV